jgi:hypothetical protein
MPAESLKLRLQGSGPAKSDPEIRVVLQALLDAVQALASKLDADATVTDTNYRATVDAIVLD